MNPSYLPYLKAAGMFAYMLLEMYLGKSKRILANSVLELVLNLIVSKLKKRGLL